MSFAVRMDSAPGAPFAERFVLMSPSGCGEDEAEGKDAVRKGNGERGNGESEEKV